MDNNLVSTYVVGLVPYHGKLLGCRLALDLLPPLSHLVDETYTKYTF